MATALQLPSGKYVILLHPILIKGNTSAIQNKSAQFTRVSVAPGATPDVIVWRTVSEEEFL